jgi:predicted nucleic acid-binding protein
MSAEFLDSNVILYLASGDDVKANRAEELVGAGGVISVQVLNEVANVLRRKLAMSWQDTRRFLADVRALLPTVHPLSLSTHEHALELADRYGLSVYDGLIVASALEAQCSVLWSEDMQNGLVIEGVLRIKNPFHFGRIRRWG